MKTFLPTWFMPIRGGKRQGILALHMIKPQWCRLEKNHEFLVHMQLFQILKYKFFFLDDVKK